MENKTVRASRLTLARYSLAVALSLSASAVTADEVSAIPDEGISDCVSFKHGTSANPLTFTFGYACVSDMYCEVSSHGCVDEYCEQFDYSRGTRTALTTVPLATRVDQISMAPMGEDLAENGAWCLVQDGAGNFWALDKQRGEQTVFTPQNSSETIVRCQTSDYFSSDLGCVAGDALP